jgi:hypothetical protein
VKRLVDARRKLCKKQNTNAVSESVSLRLEVLDDDAPPFEAQCVVMWLVHKQQDRDQPTATGP